MVRQSQDTDRWGFAEKDALDQIFNRRLINLRMQPAIGQRRYNRLRTCHFGSIAV